MHGIAAFYKTLSRHCTALDLKPQHTTSVSNQAKFAGDFLSYPPEQLNNLERHQEESDEGKIPTLSTGLFPRLPEEVNHEGGPRTGSNKEVMKSGGNKALATERPPAREEGKAGPPQRHEK